MIEYKFSWDDLQMNLEFTTKLGYKIDAHETFDFRRYDIEELQFEIKYGVATSCCYWPADSLSKRDISEVFVSNLAQAIDNCSYDEDGFPKIPDFYEVKRDGTIGPMSDEKKLRSIKEKEERRERMAEITGKLFNHI